LGKALLNVFQQVRLVVLHRQGIVPTPLPNLGCDLLLAPHGMSSRNSRSLGIIASSARGARVHRGHTDSRNITVLRQEDLAGADYHLFTGHDAYLWNNDFADCASLWMAGASEPFDKACYSENPPEGVVLYRSKNRLVPSRAKVAGRG
jgi:hypothetical protein